MTRARELMAVAMCVPAQFLGISPCILILVCLDSSWLCFSLDVSHDFCLGKQFKYPLLCPFVWFLILHLKFMSKLYLILCLLQPIETSQHKLNLNNLNGTILQLIHIHTYTRTLWIPCIQKWFCLYLFTRYEIHCISRNPFFIFWFPWLTVKCLYVVN